MRLFKDSGAKINLSSNDFIAQGGEGQVYIKGNKAYKIYIDINRAIDPQKIKELQPLGSNKRIIIPCSGLYDNKKKIVGYEMDQVPSGSITICEFSSRGYQKSHSITVQNVADLAEVIRKDVEFIHQQGILIVDLNEMNILLDKNTPFYIDTDSYQTKSFGATAIMEHIRDYSAKQWTIGSDWYSWGILTFQMFTGTHPFKGKHPAFKKHDLIERMKRGVSVFHKDASLPRNCIPLSSLPSGYCQWAKAVFEDGKRLPPPVGFVIGMPIPTAPTPVAHSTNKISIETIYTTDSNIQNIFYAGGIKVITLKDKTIINDRIYPIAVLNGSVLALDTHQNVPIAARIDKGTVKITRLTDGKTADLIVNAVGIFTSNGRLHIKTIQGTILEIRSIGKNASYSTKVVANIMPKSSKIVGEGILYEAFGQWFLVTFPREGESYQLKLPEIQNKKVITACYKHNVLMVTISNKGKYSRINYRINPTFTNYECWIENNIQPALLSFDCLPNGICAFLNEENNIELLQNIPNGMRKVVDDDQAIPPGTMIKSFDGNIVFIEDNKIQRIKTK